MDFSFLSFPLPALSLACSLPLSRFTKWAGNWTSLHEGAVSMSISCPLGVVRIIVGIDDPSQGDMAYSKSNSCSSLVDRSTSSDNSASDVGDILKSRWRVVSV